MPAQPRDMAALVRLEHRLRRERRGEAEGERLAELTFRLDRRSRRVGHAGDDDPAERPREAGGKNERAILNPNVCRVANDAGFSEGGFCDPDDFAVGHNLLPSDERAGRPLDLHVGDLEVLRGEPGRPRPDEADQRRGGPCGGRGREINREVNRRIRSDKPSRGHQVCAADRAGYECHKRAGPERDGRRNIVALSCKGHPVWGARPEDVSGHGPRLPRGERRRGDELEIPPARNRCSSHAAKVVRRGGEVEVAVSKPKVDVGVGDRPLIGGEAPRADGLEVGDGEMQTVRGRVQIGCVNKAHEPEDVFIFRLREMRVAGLVVEPVDHPRRQMRDLRAASNKLGPHRLEPDRVDDAWAAFALHPRNHQHFRARMGREEIVDRGDGVFDYRPARSPLPRGGGDARPADRRPQDGDLVCRVFGEIRGAEIGERVIGAVATGERRAVQRVRRRDEVAG